MKLSTNLIQGSVGNEKRFLGRSTGHGNFEDFSKHRINGNGNSENCMEFVKVIFYLLVTFLILFIGWTGWIYLTPKFSSSIRQTDTSLDSSELRRPEFRRILYGLDRRMENEDSNGILAEDVPWPSIPGNTVTTSTKSVEDDQRYHAEIRVPTTSVIETNKVIAEKSMQLWLETVKNLEDTINNQDKDESDLPTEKVGPKTPDYNIVFDTDNPPRTTSIPLMTFSDFIRRFNRHSDYIRDSSNGQVFSHGRSVHQLTSAISQSDNNRWRDDGTAQPAMKIKRSILPTFDKVDPDRAKCEESLDPSYEMMDELAIAFLTSDDYNLRIVQFREKFIEYLTRFFWYRILPRPDQRQSILKKSDYQVRSLLSAISNLVTDFGREYNFVKRSPPTQEMTQQFRDIIETVVFGFEKCMWRQELARRATAGGRL